MKATPLILETKNYILERMDQTKRKFEVIYSSSVDPDKQKECLIMIKQIEKDLKKLNADLFDDKDLRRYNISIEELQVHRYDKEIRTNINDYQILRNINKQKLNQVCNNQEINSMWSYLLFFEQEYLGLLSEKNLRLDYGHAFQRDKFFTQFNETLITLKKYGELLLELESVSSTGNNNYKERLLAIQSKQYRDLIIKTGRFLNSVSAFIDDIFESEANGERVILEPNKIVEIEGSNSNINGITASQALKDLNIFIHEFIEFLKIPDIKKIEEE